MRRTFLLYLMVSSLLAAKLWADDKSAEEALTLKECLTVVLAENFDLKVERLNLSNAYENFQIARGAYDPTLGFDLTTRKSISPVASSELDGAAAPESGSWSGNLIINQKLPTGATLGLGSQYDRAETNSSFSSLNPDFSTGVNLNLRQPLLKGGWFTYNLADLRLAKLGMSMADLTMHKAVLDTMERAESAYWDLCAATFAENIQSQSRRVSMQLLEDARAREEAGLATSLDRMQAELSLANRDQDLLLGRQMREDKRDELLAVMGVLAKRKYDFVIYVPMPELDKTPNVEQVLNNARQNSPDYLLAIKAVSQSQIQRDVVKNQALPQVDAVAGGGYSGRDGTYWDSYNRLYEREGYSWNLGVEVRMPWGLRSERAQARQAGNDFKITQLRQEDVLQNLTLSIYVAARAVKTSLERIDVIKQGRELSRKTFENSKARYEEGLMTFRDLLASQDEAERAELDLLQAKITAMKAMAHLSRLEGTSLERNGFR